MDKGRSHNFPGQDSVVIKLVRRDGTGVKICTEDRMQQNSQKNYAAFG